MNPTYELLWSKDVTPSLKILVRSAQLPGSDAKGLAYFLATPKGEISIKPSDVEALMAMAE